MPRVQGGDRPPASIYLVGFMASGKTAVGRRLAAALALPFEDVDTWIEAAAGRSVAAIWRSEGDAGFRAREAEALLRVSGRRAVIATGGGLPLLAGNRELLLATGMVLWLKVRFGILWKRGSIERRGVRPLWRERASLEALFVARRAVYRFAHVTCAVGHEEPGVTASRLASLVRAWEGRH
jgi:shikimate kinase